MTDELLAYYNRELAFVRKLGAEFASAHPKIAGRLAWSGEGSEDPHVSRIVEAFSLLAARTRRKIDDEFPEITQAMLNVLYPHYLSPTPSVAIIQSQIDPEQAQMTSAYEIPRGTPIETAPIDGMPCRFRTCYDLRLHPIRVASASYQSPPFSAPSTRVSDDAQGLIHIKLQTILPKVTFAELEIDSLSFFCFGEGQYPYDIYELILNDSLGVAVSSAADEAHSRFLDAKNLNSIGFGRDEGLFDYSAQSFLGYRLLTEYFAFPQKFLFFRLDGLTKSVLAETGTTNELSLYIYVNRHVDVLQQQVDQRTFRLGCTPIVNLYRQRAEPIRCRHTVSEHRVVPDARRPKHHEIYRIERVIGTGPSNEEFEFVPFFSTKHGQPAKPRALWNGTRRSASYSAADADRATEIYLSLVDLNFEPNRLSDWTIDVETLCLNRDLPRKLPFGGGQPDMHFTGEGSLAQIECLTRPTPTRRPELGDQTMWRLISHLSLNHLSLVDTSRGAEALREILSLYDPADSDETRQLISGLTNVSSRRVVGRVGSSVSAGFCRGTEVTLNLDEEKFSGNGAYLFASVMERFLALYTSLNSFTKTVVATNRRAQLFRWPPRAGEQVLV